MVDLNSKEMSQKTSDKAAILSSSVGKNQEFSPKKKLPIKTPKRVELRVKSHKEHTDKEKTQKHVSPEDKEPVSHKIDKKEVSMKTKLKDFFSVFLRKTKKYSFLAIENIKKFYLYAKPKCIDFFHVTYPKVKSFSIQLWEATKKLSKKTWVLLCDWAQKAYIMLKNGIGKIKSRKSK